MISITKKHNCCGCNACLQVCPKECIVMREDNEGFLYPDVDQSICIDCHLCEKVCPVLNQGEPRKPLKVYAAKNKDEEILKQSSSGGIFSLLAEQVIDEGGVVFGARFDENWEVKHDYTETIEGLAAFRGSKYVQSRMEDNYKKAENFLKQGRKVLFSGTPCQIAGLKRFLRKEYENLLTVDFICHGVPSPKVWRMYLDETIARQGVGKNTVSSHSIDRKKFIRSIEFRSKSMGWKKFSFALTLSEAIDEGEKNSVLLSSVFLENTFMKIFLSDICLRPSCYKCKFRKGRSHSDLKIADFWDIEKRYPQLYDFYGVSWIGAMSAIGEASIGEIEEKAFLTLCDLQANIKENVAYIISPYRLPFKRAEFYKKLETCTLNELSDTLCVKGKYEKYICRIIRIYRKLKEKI